MANGKTYQGRGDNLSDGQVAEWSCSGLQSRVRRFDSDPGLHSIFLRSSVSAQIGTSYARVAKSVDAADLKSAEP